MNIFILITITVSFIAGLIAALLIPSRARIRKDCVAVIRSKKKTVVYVIGVFLLSVGIAVFLLLFENVIQYDIAYLLNTIFYMLVGMGLIIENFRKHRYARAIIRTGQQYRYVQGTQ